MENPRSWTAEHHIINSALDNAGDKATNIVDTLVKAGYLTGDDTDLNMLARELDGVIERRQHSVDVGMCGLSLSATLYNYLFRG